MLKVIILLRKISWVFLDIVVGKAMTKLQQFLDILMGCLHKYVILTVKRYTQTATVTALIW